MKAFGLQYRPAQPANSWTAAGRGERA